jgi:hypothetical protein
MIKFKDLYVANREPGSDLREWIRVLANGPTNCQGNQTGSISGPTCQGLIQALVKPTEDWSKVTLKQLLQSALEKAVQESDAINDPAQLKQLEGKLQGALDEVRERQGKPPKSASATQ